MLTHFQPECCNWNTFALPVGTGMLEGSNVIIHRSTLDTTTLDTKGPPRPLVAWFKAHFFSTYFHLPTFVILPCPVFGLTSNWIPNFFLCRIFWGANYTCSGIKLHVQTCLVWTFFLVTHLPYRLLLTEPTLADGFGHPFCDQDLSMGPYVYGTFVKPHECLWGFLQISLFFLFFFPLQFRDIKNFAKFSKL
jgi:hypothetical protein